MKEVTLETSHINKYALLSLIMAGPVIILVYKLFHGENYKETMYSYNPFLLFTIFILSIIALVILHELIHALFFGLYAKHRFKTIKFGIKWNILAPYCHCKEAITAKQYGIVLLMPTIILGLIPLLIGFIIGNLFITLLGNIFTIGGMGDIMVFWLLKKVPITTFVIDHPDKVGFYYED